MRRALVWIAPLLLVTACLTEFEVVIGASDSGPQTTASGGGSVTSGASAGAGSESDGGGSGTSCTMCGELCVDLSSDPEHCGECERECESDALCIGGQCQQQCEGACDGGTQLCVAEQCVCKPGLSLCEGACVNLESNPAHCGACGLSCDGDPCGASQCQPDGCGELQQCGDSCVELARDVEHCGECGNTCEYDELCWQGECRDAVPKSCLTCPCGDCEGDRCCQYDDLSVILCVEADACPEP